MAEKEVDAYKRRFAELSADDQQALCRWHVNQMDRGDLLWQVARSVPGTEVRAEFLKLCAAEYVGEKLMLYVKDKATEVAPDLADGDVRGVFEGFWTHVSDLPASVEIGVASGRDKGSLWRGLVSGTAFAVWQSRVMSSPNGEAVMEVFRGVVSEFGYSAAEVSDWLHERIPPPPLLPGDERAKDLVPGLALPVFFGSEWGALTEPEFKNIVGVGAGMAEDIRYTRGIGWEPMRDFIVRENVETMTPEERQAFVADHQLERDEAEIGG